MIRSALLLCATILGLACSACTAPTPVAGGPPPPVTCNAGDVNSFVPSKVSVLDAAGGWTPYPSGANPGYGEPPKLLGGLLAANTADDLTQAFSAAPIFFASSFAVSTACLSTQLLVPVSTSAAIVPGAIATRPPAKCT
jgi:hypothetical protein